jgi:N-acetylglucosamine-6-phosphate deacetylase
MLATYCAAKVFTGKEILFNHSIITDDTNTIIDILPQERLHKNVTQELPVYPFIAPSFIDIQIYGAGGKLLSAHPNSASLFALKDYCLNGGAAFFLPTVATNSYAVFYNCIDAVKQYWKDGGTGCLGLHVEGPWLNPIKRGAHIESYIHIPTLDNVQPLLDYGKDVIKMITLAPEVCSNDVIELIQSHHIIISAGHSNATFQQANEAFNKGIKAVTHLYNAMSGLQHREPGLVGASFLHQSVMARIVADGYHVNFDAIKIAYKQMKGRLFCITDAVTETASEPYPHTKDGDKYISNNILSGSALTMAKALQNLVKKAGIELEEELRMVSLYPAKILGLDDSLGKIEKGYKACFTALNNQLDVVEIL